MVNDLIKPPPVLCCHHQSVLSCGSRGAGAKMPLHTRFGSLCSTMCFLGFIPAADGASSWPRVGVRHRAAGNAGMTDPQGLPAPQHVLVCFLKCGHVGQEGEKTSCAGGIECSQRTDRKELWRAHHCLECSFGGRNSLLFLQILAGDVLVKDLTFILYAIQNPGWGGDGGLCCLQLKLFFMFPAHL